MSRKTGRYMGVERPYVLGHFEVKPLNRGASCDGFGPQKRKSFFEPYANHMSRTNSWSHDLRNRENRGDCHVSRCAFGVLCGYLCSTQGTTEKTAQPSHIESLVPKQESLRNRWTSQAFKTNWWSRWARPPRPLFLPFFKLKKPQNRHFLLKSNIHNGTFSHAFLKRKMGKKWAIYPFFPRKMGKKWGSF